MLQRTTASGRPRGEDFIVPLHGEKRTGSETTVIHGSIRPDQPPIVGTVGSDCAGLFHYLARTFREEELDVAACQGTRLRFCQESAFEFTGGDTKVRKLFTEHFHGQDLRFKVPEPGWTAMKCDLALDIRENCSGKLFEIAEALKEQNVVIEEFRAREELFPNRVAGRPGRRFLPEASFFAKLELAERVTPKKLEQTLRDHLPQDEPTITVRRVLDPFPRTTFPTH